MNEAQVRLSPLVTIQRSAHKGLEDVLANLSISVLWIGSPWPFALSCRDLHWMAMCSPSL